jgi:hypothetical protein
MAAAIIAEIIGTILLAFVGWHYWCMPKILAVGSRVLAAYSEAMAFVVLLGSVLGHVSRCLPDRATAIGSFVMATLLLFVAGLTLVSGHR